MKFISKFALLALVCLALAACNQSVEDKASANEGAGSEAETANETGRKLPECAKRNKDGTYKYGHACTEEQWIEWQKTQGAVNEPSR